MFRTVLLSFFIIFGALPASSDERLNTLWKNAYDIHNRHDYIGAVEAWTLLINDTAASKKQLSRFHYGRANALEKLNRNIEAAKDFRSSISFDPEYVPAYVNFRNFLKKNATDDAERLIVMKGLTAQGIDAIDFHFNGGRKEAQNTLAYNYAEISRIYRKMGQLDQAEIYERRSNDLRIK